MGSLTPRKFAFSDDTQGSKNSPFTVVCLVAKPLNRSEARVDFVVIQTLLLFVCKSLCYRAD